jgi:hypothetical protein
VAARPLLAVLVGGLTLAASVGAATTASAGRACISGARSGGYSYAGQQATHRGHGVRASIAVTRRPHVEAGHVAGWVGVGGPGQGASGVDAWIQAGVASTPEGDTFLYAEVVRAGRPPDLTVVRSGVALGERHRVAVLELAGRPGWWRVWVDGSAVTAPIRMRGSSGRWAPIATAESWNAGTPACNAFGFRFDRLSVSYGGGGSWRPFVPAHQFVDGANTVRSLYAATGRRGARSFVAASS